LITLLFPISTTPAAAAPEIELSPQEGPAGTTVDIKGSGFVPLSRITLTFDSQTVPTTPDTIVASAIGEFQATFEVPGDAALGDNTVTATGDGLLEASASASFLVSVPNNVPEAHPDSLTTNEDTAIEIVLRGSDADGDELSFKIVHEPDFGSVEGDPSEGTIIYSPQSDFSGVDSFSFTANDGKAESAPATISIEVLAVNDAPVLDPVAMEMDEDEEAEIWLMASDVDSSSLNFVVISSAQHGTLGAIVTQGATSASVKYVPHPDYYGQDSFEIEVSDQEGASDREVASISVNAVQDAPTANDTEIVTVSGRPVSFSLSGSDPDGDQLNYVITSQPRNGSLSGTGQNITYTSSLQYHGTDSFSYKVNDGIADSNSATVKINVNQVPSDNNQPRGHGTRENTTSEPATSPKVPETQIDEGQSSEPIPSKSEQPTLQEQPSAGVRSGDETHHDTSGPEQDVTRPRLVFPDSPLIFTATSPEGAEVNYNVVAIDDQDGELKADCSPASGSRLPVGKVNVLCTAQDKAGNTALDSFVVEVRLVGQNESNLDMPIIAGAIGIAAFTSIMILRQARRSKLEASKSQSS
jgi:hypothetical protein